MKLGGMSFKFLSGLLVALISVASLGFAGARAEGNCPLGQFPDEIQPNKCVHAYSSSPLPLTEQQPMRFEAVQMSMVMTWIQATGTITADTPKLFAKFLHDNGRWLPNTIYLHSPGGDLVAGLRLGEMIREARLNTTIGHTIDLEGAMNIYTYPGAHCFSACAYAFLGGVSRSYTNDEIFGVHRFGALQGSISGEKAQIVTSILAKYVQDMGVDLSVLELASVTEFKDDIFRVPVSLAKQTHIIYDPTGLTSFSIEYHDGTTVAKFSLEVRQRHLDGVLLCASGTPLLIVEDKTNGIPQELSIAHSFPAQFKSPHGTITAAASYVARASQDPPAMAFLLPGLTQEDFLGAGLSLSSISNPMLDRSKKSGAISVNQLSERLKWSDAVDALWFSVIAENARNTLPLVLNGCRH